MKKSQRQWEFPSGRSSAGARITKVSVAHWPRESYEYEEEKKIIEYDKDGNVKPIKIEKTKKQVPPDVGAQCFWLKNRQRDKWQDRPEVIPDTGADDGDQVQFYLPDNGRDG